jgi:hypothetical protein
MVLAGWARMSTRTTHPTLHGATGSDAGTAREPALPHERDESSRQGHGTAGDAPRPVSQQAHDDTQRGLQDTSRKPEADRAYEMQKGQGAAGTAPAAPDQSGAGRHDTDAGNGPGERRHASAPRTPRTPR